MFKKISQLFPFLSIKQFIILLLLGVSIGVLATSTTTSKLTKAEKTTSHKIKKTTAKVRNKYRKKNLVRITYPDKLIVANMAKSHNNVFFDDMSATRTFPVGRVAPKSIRLKPKAKQKKCKTRVCPTGAAIPPVVFDPSPFLIPVAAVVATGVAVPLATGGGGDGPTPIPPTPPIPEPSSIILGLMSLGGMLISRKRTA